MEKIKINELILVEGRYDVIALSNVADALIIACDGFSIFKDEEKKQLVKTVGSKRGIIIFTDSDSAGFKIRNYVNKILQNTTANIFHAYIPEVYGKEQRKTTPGKEGLIGVEGMPPHVLLKALQNAGIKCAETNDLFENSANAPPVNKPAKDCIDYALLYTLGLSGTKNSAQKRTGLLKSMGLPGRLSKFALVNVLNSLYTKEEFISIVENFNR